MSYIEVLASIGTVMAVMRGAPQAWRSWVQGHSGGLSKSMLWLWGIGSMLLIPYCYESAHLMLPIYISNVLFVSVMLRYKYFKRPQTEEKNEYPEWYVESEEQEL
jgi:hypothetical protein